MIELETDGSWRMDLNMKMSLIKEINSLKWILI